MKLTAIFSIILLSVSQVTAYDPTYVANGVTLDDAGLAALLTPPKDKCILWTGEPPAAPGGKKYADMNAYIDNSYLKGRGVGGVTVAALVKAGGIASATRLTKTQYRPWWGGASRAFAGQAKGVVRVVLGTPRDISTYKTWVLYTDELPQLTRPGSGVTKIVQVSAADPTIENTVWIPGMPQWGAGFTEPPVEVFSPPASAGCSGIVKRGLGGDACPMPVRGTKKRPTPGGTSGTTKGKTTGGVTVGSKPVKKAGGAPAVKKVKTTGAVRGASTPVRKTGGVRAVKKVTSAKPRIAARSTRSRFRRMRG